MCVCVLKYMYVWHVHGGAWKGQKRHWTPQNWSYKWMWVSTWFLKIVSLQDQWVLLTWATQRLYFILCVCVCVCVTCMYICAQCQQRSEEGTWLCRAEDTGGCEPDLCKIPSDSLSGGSGSRRHCSKLSPVATWVLFRDLSSSEARLLDCYPERISRQSLLSWINL